MLLKISQRLGGAVGSAGPAGPPAPPQKPPEVTNLFEACRWGDLEAAEDFIAIGKGINDTDKEGRTPLCVPRGGVPVARGRTNIARRRHFAVAFGKGDVGMQIVKALLEAGAKPDAADVKKNTVLHYASGCVQNARSWHRHMHAHAGCALC